MRCHTDFMFDNVNQYVILLKKYKTEFVILFNHLFINYKYLIAKYHSISPFRGTDIFNHIYFINHTAVTN